MGIAADVPSDVADRSQALMIYRPWAPGTRLYQPFVRADRSTDVVARAAAAAVMQPYAGLVAAPSTIEAQLAFITGAFERIGEIVGAVALLAAMLAVVGVYGAIALAAKRRFKEMGIRIALGARAPDVYGAMIKPSAGPVIVGLVAGTVVATAIAVVADGMVGAVLPARLVDPFAFLIAGSSLAAVAVLAMLLPARRATVLQPATVLRQD